MKTYYVQILCKVGPTKFIEEGLLENYGEYLIYRDIKQGFIEAYSSWRDFKKSMVYDLKDFSKYCKVVELK